MAADSVAVSEETRSGIRRGRGEGQGAHSLDEWWLDTGDAHRGVQRVLLLVLDQAGGSGSY